MALTPQNNDAFFREVDDELRRSQLGAFGRRWGKWIGIAIVLALIGLAGWLWWGHQRTQQAGQSGEKLDQALTMLEQQRGPQAKPLLAELATDGRPGYRAAAKLAQADLLFQDGKTKEAAAAFKAIAADDSLDQSYRDLALVRQTATEFDTLPPAEVIARMKPLAVAGQPWFGSAAEMTAAAHLKMNKPDLAGPLFAAIAKDDKSPGTLRTRAAQMASAMGLDVAPPGAPNMGGETQ